MPCAEGGAMIHDKDITLKEEYYRLAPLSSSEVAGPVGIGLVAQVSLNSLHVMIFPRNPRTCGPVPYTLANL